MKRPRSPRPAPLAAALLAAARVRAARGTADPAAPGAAALEAAGRPGGLLRAAARLPAARRPPWYLPRPAAARPTRRRPLPADSAPVLLTAFGALGAAHLAALAAGAKRLEHLTKPALMPALAAYAAARGAPRPLVAALLLSCAGDVLLQVGGELPFLLGMGCFAAAHLCFTARFVRGGALASRSRVKAVAALYGAVWLLGTAALWPHLGDLRLPVAVYGLLLSCTAVTAAGLGPRPALGGALFLLSDTLIAFGIARWRAPDQDQVLVMATYLAAEFLLASGLLLRQDPADRPGPGPAAATA